ncbi:L-aspartate oxidase [Marinospirillum celere]|uniref:L-aspartate oxidase n=1 Tax=Marinospirillum celere TaxID=1122252 RepID=A0A1I1FTH5_9GAMM|nr:L-aspartate oxidase [Marinospirillum celere]SFC02601.1 L-aspartate oxidase [Marinospirillum celere]
MLPTREFDVVLLGSGAAGMTAALHLARDYRVALLSKSELGQGSTRWAQGGIAAVVDPEDTQDAHVQDTLIAGAGLCHQDTVERVVGESQQAIEWLINQGVPFTPSSPEVDPEEASKQPYHLTREGGHSHRRILHADDATGRAIIDCLTARIRENANIEVFENHLAVDLITRHKLGLAEQACVGVYALDNQLGQVRPFSAPAVILATGGASKVYLYTSNPDGSSGDGIAMAWRAGCRVANMEFNQFHPTCLYHPKAKTFLISEALRGEGARLLLPDGQPFMQRFDQRQELAPRDIVARAIDHEMKRLGLDHVYLDISHQPADFIKSHFPTIYQRCLEFGIDITREPLPVVPAAHYTCGGVVTNEWGETDIPGLFAIGECAFTGLHGANRMASNSLLECVVYGRLAATQLLNRKLQRSQLPTPPAWDESQVTDSDEDVVISHNWDEIRRFMWDYVGIVRTDKRLERASHRIKLLQTEIHDYYSNYRISGDLLELRNLATVAELIIQSAQLRKESRGLHYTLDYPEPAAEARDTLLTPARW